MILKGGQRALHFGLFGPAPNQMPNLQADSRPDQATKTGSQSPDESKPSTMPGHDGIRFADDQGVHPARPQTAERHLGIPAKMNAIPG